MFAEDSHLIEHLFILFIDEVSLVFDFLHPHVQLRNLSLLQLLSSLIRANPDLADLILLDQVDHQLILPFDNVVVVIDFLLRLSKFLGVRIYIELLPTLQIQYLLLQVFDLGCLADVEL